MKFFLAFVAVVAVASSAAVRPKMTEAELHEVIAAIHSPSTDPATAAALEQMLLDLVGHEVSVGPAIVELPVAPSPVDFVESAPVIGVDPVIVPAPVEPVVVPSPVSFEEGPAAVSSSSPLVQIIVNVNQASQPSEVIPISPVVDVPALVEPSPVHFVESEEPTIVEPVIVVDQPNPAPEPVIIVPGPEVAPEPVIVVPGPEIVPDPIIIAPAPEVIVPEPIVIAPAPEVIVPEPIVIAPAPEVIVPEPIVIAPAPEVIVPEPVVIAPEVIVPEPVIIPAPAVNLPEALN